jgi:predicted DNA-binding antitoxin AbrB/MazE fold protein
MMRTIRAIYDGKTLKLLENVEVATPQEVLIVFIHDEKLANEEVRAAEIQELIENSAAFDFLRQEEEDVYTDADLKVRY